MIDYEDLGKEIAWRLGHEFAKSIDLHKLMRRHPSEMPEDLAVELVEEAEYFLEEKELLDFIDPVDLRTEALYAIDWYQSS